MGETLYWYQPVRLSVREILKEWVPGSQDQPWTWAQEGQDLLERICVCCNKPGHYQFMLVSAMLAKGEFWGEKKPVLGDDGRVWDGHHRLIAAAALGWDTIGVKVAHPIPEEQ